MFTIAQTLAPVTCAKGLRVLPDKTVAEAGALDVVIVPGGRGTRALIEDKPTHEWLHGLAKGGTLVTSVHGLARARRRRASPEPARHDLVGRPRPTPRARPDHRGAAGRALRGQRGAVVTAAGVSAGIDMALRTWSRACTRWRAREVRRYIQYDPEPPV